MSRFHFAFSEGGVEQRANLNDKIHVVKKGLNWMRKLNRALRQFWQEYGLKVEWSVWSMKERWKHFEHTRAWNDVIIAAWQKMIEQLWNFPGRESMFAESDQLFGGRMFDSYPELWNLFGCSLIRCQATRYHLNQLISWVCFRWLADCWYWSCIFLF